MDAVAKLVSDLEKRAEKVRATLAEEERRYEQKAAPLREELVKVEDALSRLGAWAGSSRTPNPGTRKRAKASGRSRSTRAPRGANKSAILRYIKANPGAKATDIAVAVGIAKP